MAWAPNYCTTEQLAEYVRIDDLMDEAELGAAIAAASRAVDYTCNRQFGKVDQADDRRYTAVPDYERGWWLVTVDDVSTAQGVTVDVDGTAVTAFELEPVNAGAEGRPFTRLAFTSASERQPTGRPHEVAITAVWGWEAIPDAVVQATLLQASRLFARRQAPFGIAGSPDTGSEMRLLAKVDPDVAVSLRGLSRPRGIG